MKSIDEIYKENGFTNEMLLPEHLVKMLMHDYAKQFINICDTCEVKKTCLNKK